LHAVLEEILRAIEAPVLMWETCVSNLLHDFRSQHAEQDWAGAEQQVVALFGKPVHLYAEILGELEMPVHHGYHVEHLRCCQARLTLVHEFNQLLLGL